MQGLMWPVVAAMMPAVVAAAWVYGVGVWRLLAVVTVAAVAAEAVCLYWRGQQWRGVRAGVADGSAVVTAVILAVMIPPYAAWTAGAAAAVAAVVLAKHCYGGVGHNVFNPAMAGYALAFLAFPQEFERWAAADAVSSPTPLAAMRLQLPFDHSIVPAVVAAVGGAVLLAWRVADWRLTVGFVLGAAVAQGASGEAWVELLYGGLLFAAFFVITDPVTAAATAGGRWCYAFAVGAAAVWLRYDGSHTDAIAFAVLLGNIFAPLFDYPPQWWRKHHHRR